VPGEASGRERAFRASDRHSNIVRVLRVAVPLTAVCAVLGYALMLGTSWRIGTGRLDVGKVELTPDDLTMKNPSYFGVTKDGGRYVVRAKKAVLDFDQKAPIRLYDIDGDLIQANNVATKLKAKRGLLDNAKSELELYDGIEIDATNGLSARLTRATIYSKEHRIVSKEPVDATMPAGSVRSLAMTLKTDTRQATFTGAVNVTLVPGASGSQGLAALGRDSRQPVEVRSEQLDVNDIAKTAEFRRNVVATQGESTLRAAELQVRYVGRAEPFSDPRAASAPGEERGARLSRLVARTGVIVTAGSDRRVSSDQAEFDADADTALFLGNVLVNQGKNVLQGRRLFVDRRAGKSRLDAPGEGGQAPGRIAATFYQSDNRAVGESKAKPARAKSAGDAQEALFGTFKTDPNAPIDIESDWLEVNDGSRVAIFRGDVRARQGDFRVRTVELHATYSGQSGFALSAAPEEGGRAPPAPAQLVRVEAKQKVLITSKDGQTASGDWAVFDVKANTVLLGDHVVVTRGKDVAEGPRLKIDLNTGLYRFEADSDAQGADVPGAPGAARTGEGATAKRTCPPGKQCLLFYPKEAKEAAKKALPPAAAKAAEGWEPSTSASPVLRGE
jgi:LPS export ABC transporter protein LptC